jgi:hypothetical protein
MWNRLDEDRIKKAKKDSTAKKDADSSTPEQRALPDGWRFPELILFEYFGLPSGENSCLEVLKTPVVGSGPTPVNPNSLGKSARNTIALGEKNSVAENYIIKLLFFCNTSQLSIVPLLVFLKILEAKRPRCYRKRLKRK